MKTYIINVRYGGLGDHLFFSPIPRLLKEKYDHKCRVFLSTEPNFRHWQTYELVWAKNPYLDGVIDPLTFQFEPLAKLETSTQVMKDILKQYSIDFEEEPKPEIYWGIDKRKDLPKFVVDLNFSSFTGLLLSDLITISEMFDKKFVFVNPSSTLKKFISPVQCFQTKSLFDYASLIYSSEEFFCLTSGGATLAAALGVRAKVFAVQEYPEYFKHSINYYIDVGRKGYLRSAVYRYLWSKNLKFRVSFP